MRLCERRRAWRRDAGRTVPNLGRLASIVALTADGERIPIFTARGTFRLTLDGQQFSLADLSDAEGVALGWLLRDEGFSDGGCE